MVDTVDRGPYHSMIDRQALALQAQTGESYASAFTKCYTDPSNKVIVDNARLEHLSQGHDAIYGTRFSMPPNAGVKKALADATLEAQARRRMATTGETFAKAYSAIYTAPENIALRNGVTEPLAKAAEIAENFGPAHARLHSMAVDHQRAHSGMSYESAYSHLYSRVENAPLREKIKAEHLRASMAAVQSQPGLGKAAAAVTNDASPGSAHTELNWLVTKRMKSDPKLSYERAFTAEYLLPENRTLKSRYDSEPDCAGR